METLQAVAPAILEANHATAAGHFEHFLWGGSQLLTEDRSKHNNCSRPLCSVFHQSVGHCVFLTPNSVDTLAVLTVGVKNLVVV